MKKILILILAAALLLMAAGCTPDSNFDPADLAARSEAYNDALMSGDYAAVAADFSADMAQQISVEALETAWLATLAPLGAYVQRVSTEGEEITSGAYTVRVLEEYENNGVLFSYTYDAAGKISGLFLNYESVKPNPTSELWTEYPVTVGEYALPGMLTLPTGVETPPVVLLVAGSGPNDMDETIGAANNKPFRDIAYGLAEQGIATLRYDKRYHAQPQLASSDEVTAQTEVLDDVSAALQLLADDERVDGQRIYVLGHSMGGMLAPRIAAEHSARVKGLLIAAGTLRDLAELLIDQNRVLAEQQSVGADEATIALIQEQLAAVERDSAAILALTGDDGNSYLGVPAGYWYSMSQAGGLNYLDQLDLPMFIFQGDADFQVYPDKDFPLWEQYLGERDNVTIKLYPGLNHLLMPTTGLNTTEDYDTPANVSPELIADMADWIAAN